MRCKAVSQAERFRIFHSAKNTTYINCSVPYIPLFIGRSYICLAVTVYMTLYLIIQHTLQYIFLSHYHGLFVRFITPDGSVGLHFSFHKIFIFPSFPVSTNFVIDQSSILTLIVSHISCNVTVYLTHTVPCIPIYCSCVITGNADILSYNVRSIFVLVSFVICFLCNIFSALYFLCIA